MQVQISCHPYVINTMDFVKVSSNDANDTLVLILAMADYHPCHFGLEKKYLTSLKFRPVAMVVWRILGFFRMKLNVIVSWEKKV
jgi:hypothetical protein